MSGNIDKLNAIHDQLKPRVDGSIHNTLWQIMVNDSLQGAEAAFINVPSHPCFAIALGEGGYLSANFDAKMGEDVAEILDYLNREVFGLTPLGVDRVTVNSMRRAAS